MIFLQLFYRFFMIGLFMFGGGNAAIPFLQQLSESTGWFTLQQLMDVIAVSEASPGPVAVDMATYVGYLIAGVPGGVTATLSLLAPTVIIALIVARMLTRFKDNPLVESAFYGLRPASLGLIAAADLTVMQMSLLRLDVWEQTRFLPDLFNIRAVILAAALFISMRLFKKVNPVVFLIASAAAGLLFLG